MMELLIRSQPVDSYGATTKLSFPRRDQLVFLLPNNRVVASIFTIYGMGAGLEGVGISLG